MTTRTRVYSSLCRQSTPHIHTLLPCVEEKNAQVQEIWNSGWRVVCGVVCVQTSGPTSDCHRNNNSSNPMSSSRGGRERQSSSCYCRVMPASVQHYCDIMQRERERESGHWLRGGFPFLHSLMYCIFFLSDDTLACPSFFAKLRHRCRCTV